MSKRILLFALTGALLAALFAASALGKSTGSKWTKPSKPAKPVTYVFEGPIQSVNKTAGTVTLKVERANNAAQSSWASLDPPQQVVGQQISFAVTGARISLDDAKARPADLNVGQIATIKDNQRKGITDFTAESVDKVSAETPPAPYYSDGDGWGAGEHILYVPGTEPASFVSQGGTTALTCPTHPTLQASSQMPTAMAWATRAIRITQGRAQAPIAVAADPNGRLAVLDRAGVLSGLQLT